MEALAKIFASPTTYLILAIAVLGLTTYTEHLRADDYEAKYQLAQQNLAGAESANKTDQTAITQLQASLSMWKSGAEKAAQDEDNAVAALKAQALDLIAARNKLSQQEKTDNALPDCAKLEAVDLATVCPAHAAAERVRSAASSGVQGSGGAGPGAHPGRARFNLNAGLSTAELFTPHWALDLGIGAEPAG